MGQPSGEFRQEGARTRSGELVAGGLLVAIGTPEGSEARPCPEEWRPRPRRTGPGGPARGASGGDRAVGPLALGAGPADLPLLDREADIAQLLGLLAEGRSVRLVGQAGSGRSALLSAVAEAAAGLAPDGVVRLCGHRRTAADLVQDLFAATHHAPGHRPDPGAAAQHLAAIGAIVVIDGVEPVGEELEQLLAAAPDCAFLISVAPDTPLQTPGSRLQDHLVAGLSRSACLALTARLAGRALDEAEKAWAVDLWFESEGLPLRFVQAAALLRQRDVAVDALVAAEEDRHDVFGTVDEPVRHPDPAVRESALRRTVPLPSVAESAAPAVRLAEGLSEPARAVLRLAVALGGECPTAPHLPALIDVGQGESALHELADCGLAVSIGGHHRLTAGALELLAPHWPARTSLDGAAEHFAWWVGHTSVSTRQIAAEAEVVIGVLLADRAAGRHQDVLRLARAAAPALALALRWGAWERTLQLGLEAARATSSGVDEAWFHHELGVYAICVQSPARATVELEAALALRAALGEPRGAAPARRMLDLLRAEGRQLPAAPADPQSGRRPVIRAIAQVPWRFKTTPRLRHNRRTLIAASAAVAALGVLGTAVALSVSAQEGEKRTDDRRVSRNDGAFPPGGLPAPRPGSSSPAAATGATAAPEPDPATTGPGASMTSGSPSPSPSASTRKPTKSPTATASSAPPTTTGQPPQPTEQPKPPQPTQSSTGPTTPTGSPTSANPTSPSPTSTTSPSTPSPT
ncbi:ATP-binding protein [Kitasatospora sp. NPDC054939]